MKAFRAQISRKSRSGFSLAEATLSIGLLSFGFLALVPLLGLGLKSARQARDNRATAEIARTLTEEARQGTLPSGILSLDQDGNLCASTVAAYHAESTTVSETAGPGGATGLTRLTLRVTPLGAPDRVRTYAVVFATP